jgi:hypothetical protein
MGTIVGENLRNIKDYVDLIRPFKVEIRVRFPLALPRFPQIAAGICPSIEARFRKRRYADFLGVRTKDMRKPQA